MIDYIHDFLCGVISHPFTNFNDKFSYIAVEKHEWGIISQTFVMV